MILSLASAVSKLPPDAFSARFGREKGSARAAPRAPLGRVAGAMFWSPHGACSLMIFKRPIEGQLRDMAADRAADLVILYGSQTGNAEDLAKRIGRQASERNLNVLVQTMDDFALKTLPRQKFIIFVCSTTGHGQEPENMKNLFNFIRRRDLPQGCLSKLKFAVYGLGDSSYAKFNYVSKILFKRLKECEAEPMQELVAGDEQHPYGCDGVIYPKLNELWSKLKVNQTNIGSPRNSYSVKMYPDNQGPIPAGEFTQDFIDRYDIKTATCVANQRITSQLHFQDTRFLTFATKETLTYEPGDVCSIYPANLDQNVMGFIKLLNLNSLQRVKTMKLDPNYMINYLYDFVPDGLKIEDLVRYYFDIQSVPKRSFFEHLWPFSEDQLEQNKLQEFASTEGQEEVYEYCIKPRRNILEVFADFPNTVKNIKFEYLFDLIPPIKPRSFSIASAPGAHPNEISLIVGVVQYKTSMRKERRGLCSNYLAALEPADSLNDSAVKSELKFHIRRTSFKLPTNRSTPVVMIGPGLGIAPFRSFIEDRTEHHDGCDGFALNNLYFGCRFPDRDYYFRDQLEGYAERSALRLRIAFSRVEPKQYVQDLMLDDCELLRKLIMDKNATVYVAGNSKLPEEVRVVLGKILLSDVGDSEQSTQAERVVVELESTNRLQYDCW